MSVGFEGPSDSELEGFHEVGYCWARYQDREVDYCKGFTVDSIPVGNYRFKVTYGDGDVVITSEMLTESDINPIPLIDRRSLLPLDGAILTPHSLNFSWDEVEGAQA